MNTQLDPRVQPRRLGRSILAVLAGIAVGIVLSVGTDWGLHLIGLVPAPAQNDPWPNQFLLLAAVYRSIYGVIAGYLIARLAPNRPMGHSLLAGALGTLVCILAAFATWSRPSASIGMELRSCSRHFLRHGSAQNCA